MCWVGSDEIDWIGMKSTFVVDFVLVHIGVLLSPLAGTVILAQHTKHTNPFAKTMVVPATASARAASVSVSPDGPVAAVRLGLAPHPGQAPSKPPERQGIAHHNCRFQLPCLPQPVPRSLL